MLFGRSKSQEAEAELISLLPPSVAVLDFGAFPPGIDNVRADVTFSPAFARVIRQIVEMVLLEFGTGSKRVGEPPSDKIRQNLTQFASIYSNQLETATYRCQEGKRIDRLQLFQVAAVGLVLDSLRVSAEQLMERLRLEAMQCTRGDQRAVELHERATRLSHQKQSLLPHAAQLIFSQMQAAEKGMTGNLRESLLGERWPLAEAMLFNPLLLYRDREEEFLQMTHYVMLNQRSTHPYSFPYLDALLDQALDSIADRIHASAAQSLLRKDPAGGGLLFSWKDSPEALDLLFDVEGVTRALAWAHDKAEQAPLAARLKLRRDALDHLAGALRRAKVLEHISAAYLVPEIYPRFAYALKPDMIYRVLVDEMPLEAAAQKIEVQQKIRKKPRSGDVWESPASLLKIKKDAQKAAQTDTGALSLRFLRDFVRYRRDLKYKALMQGTIHKIHLLHEEKQLRLSKSNGILQEFLQREEYSQDSGKIRGHAVLKADIRGSTTMVDELNRRGLNPATHFSLNFFDPISKLLETFGAEKVFIEGDAVILTLFEHDTDPSRWTAVARACGVALSILGVVETQNRVCQENGLPLLELGIGICYTATAPTFLYDGSQRIMISPAIGKADRLSSCSWALRRKFANRKMATRVLVFNQPEGQFKGEKGVTTLRYNLNGIELEGGAFTKLQQEISLQPLPMQFPGDAHSVLHSGRYPDLTGQMHELLIRAGRVRQWQPDSEDYPVLEENYYEVMPLNLAH